MLIHSWWEFKVVHPLWKTVWGLLNKLKIKLSDDLAILLQGIQVKEWKSGYNKGTSIPIFILALFKMMSYVWKQPICPRTYE
jgi:hypothetical protein